MASMSLPHLKKHNPGHLLDRDNQENWSYFLVNVRTKRASCRYLGYLQRSELANPASS